eukprot:scaffold25415_cov45-Isochrysis_galbana.AAC.1
MGWGLRGGGRGAHIVLGLDVGARLHEAFGRSLMVVCHRNEQRSLPLRAGRQSARRGRASGQGKRQEASGEG